MAQIEEIINTLSGRFNAAAAGSMQAIFQFDIDNESYCLKINNGTCIITPGKHDSPTVTFTLNAETFGELIAGNISGMQAFMTGKLKTQGDMMLATKLGPLFGLS